MIQDPRRDKISVDDLLKVKKAERPHREFWNDWQSSFDQKLTEAKQARRSHLLDYVAKSWITLARWQLPLGLGALAALGYFVFVQLQPAAPAPNLSSSVEKAYVGVEMAPPSRSLSGTASPLLKVQPSSAAAGASNMGSVSALLGVNPFGNPVEELPSPSSQAIATNYSVVQALEPETWDRLMSGVNRLPSRASEMRPLRSERAGGAQVAFQRSNLGFSYFGSYISHSRSQDDGLEDERVFDSVARRLGQKSDRELSLKF